MHESVVLLPGSLCDAELWRHQVAHLAHACEVRVGELTQDGTIAGMAGRVLDTAPDRFALAGLSLGGIVAFEILRRAPERVTRLALLDTNSLPPRPDQVATWQRFIALAESGRYDEITPRYLLPGLLSAAGQRDGRLQRAVLAMAARVGSAACVRQYQAQISRPDSRPTLAWIACPAIVVCGREDSLCPPDVHEEMAKAIPAAALVVVEQCGHLSSLEQPQAVTAILEYWLQIS